MLNLTVAMLKPLLIFALLIQSPMVSISSPQTGGTLRGQVEVIGTMDIPGFSSAELTFAYASPSTGASDSTDTWFLIQTYSQPAADSVIAVWDTEAISDGDYALRLRVFLQDGSFQDALVADLKVRNEEPLPTPTPTQTEPAFDFPQFNQSPDVPAPIDSSPTSATVLPTATPLPPNPVSLTAVSIFSIFGKSALVVLGLFAFFSFLLRIRKNN